MVGLAAFTSQTSWRLLPFNSFLSEGQVSYPSLPPSPSFSPLGAPAVGQALFWALAIHNEPN